MHLKLSPLHESCSTDLFIVLNGAKLIWGKTYETCVLFSSFFNRTSESRKCVRHEIRPGYLLSHAPASRLPSDSSELPCAGARLQHARTQAWARRRGAANVRAAHTSREHVCMTVSHLSNTQTQMNTSVSIFLHKAHVRIKARRTGVFLIPRVLKQKVSSTIYFAWLFCWNLRSGSDLSEAKTLRSWAQMDRRLSYYGEFLLGP